MPCAVVLKWTWKWSLLIFHCLLYRSERIQIFLKQQLILAPNTDDIIPLHQMSCFNTNAKNSFCDEQSYSSRKNGRKRNFFFLWRRYSSRKKTLEKKNSAKCLRDKNFLIFVVKSFIEMVRCLQPLPFSAHLWRVLCNKVVHLAKCF